MSSFVQAYTSISVHGITRIMVAPVSSFRKWKYVHRRDPTAGFVEAGYIVSYTDSIRKSRMEKHRPTTFD